MASTPVDPLQTLSAALAVPADSREQVDLLATLRVSLEVHPGPIPILCTTLIPTVAHASDSLLKRWVLDLLHFAICRSSLTIEQRTQLSLQSLDVLASVVTEYNAATVKTAVQVFTTVYPLLFRYLCLNRQKRQPWDTLTQVKTRILEFIWAAGAPAGVKLAAMKFAQKAIIVQTRGVSDPRLQKKDDPNITMCPSDHPFISVRDLEAEGLKLLESVITLLYTSQNVDLLTAMLNSWGQLAKLRPALTQLVVSTLTSWTPAALQGLGALSVKSVEKAVRILMVHLSRLPVAGQYTQQLNEALANQGRRMDQAAAEERARKAAAKRPASGAPVTDPIDIKRIKLEHQPSSSSFLAAFDFTSLPSSMVTDFIVSSLGALSEDDLTRLVDVYKRSRPSSAPAVPAAPGPAPTVLAPAVPPPVGPPRLPPSAPSALRKSQSSTPVQPEEPPVPVVPVVKDEPVDPLAMNIDNDEMDYEPERLNQELSSGEAADEEEEEPMDVAALGIDLSDFKLPPPKVLSDPDRDVLVDKAVARLWADAGDPPPSRDAVEVIGPPDLWMLLLVRMATRAAPAPERAKSPKEDDVEKEEKEEEVEVYARQDRLRQVICDYILADFPARLRLAITWMNEEWYNDRIRTGQDPSWRPNYETWLNQFISTYQTQLDHRDRTFSRFLLDIPLVPPDVITLLRELSVDPERREVGFTSLRGFVLQRPSLRQEALGALLDLTTHPDIKTRAAAINTVRRWVPDAHPMDEQIRGFALQMLRRLHAARKRPAGNSENESVDMAEPLDEELVQTPYLNEHVEIPAQKQEILQHVELLFALSVKVPELLEELFAAYIGMDSSIQEMIQDVITPLIRTLGANHGKLLTLLREFSKGAESLALRIIKIFTDNGRPPTTLVALVKGMVAEKDLDVRFLMPIIAEMDKAEIIKHLPRIIATLNGTQENKALVRSVFESIISTPAQTFGTVTSNLPRVKQSELLTPAELMVLLHDSEKGIGLKSTIEAIGICFSMTDVYRPEVLGAVMQQIVDEPVLPTLFLRTVIQAVTTYRSLVSFVSTTLFNRLIIKKVWSNPPLWEGFIRCAKIIAPASYAALLQLPKEQLRDVVDKQPSLKSGLREHIMKTARNKARMPGFMDIFGPGDEETKSPATPSAPADAPAPAAT